MCSQRSGRDRTIMTKHTKLLLILCVGAICRADEPSPYLHQFARLDHIFALTGTRSQTGTIAVELLQLVALGHTGAIPAGAETQVGLSPGQLRQPMFADASLRAYALQKLGECDLDEALEFLQDLQRDDLGQDTTQM